MPVNTTNLLTKIKQKAMLAIVDSTNDIANELANNIRDEVPKNAGHLESSVAVIPAEIVGDGLVKGGVSIGNDEVQYAKTVWKGIPESDGRTQPPDGTTLMAFPAERWSGATISPNKNGFFVFYKVKRWQPANDFIERAMDRLGPVKRFFSKNLRIIFRIR